MDDRDQLREAARLMRERAEKAAPGPWQSDGSEIYGDTIVDWIGETCDPDDLERTDANAAHIAGWHPAVALAVAEWLNADDLYCWGPAEKARALAIAHAYLGGDRA